MKARLLLLCVFVSFVVLSFGQSLSGYKTSFLRNGAGDNWFISLGGGGQVLMGDNDNKANFEDRVTVTPTLAVGKWLNPYFGLRVKGEGGKIYGFEDNGGYKQDMKYYSVHLDGMWNLVNCIGSYNPKRLFKLAPYAGLGFTHRFELDDNAVYPAGTIGLQSGYRNSCNALTVHGGLQFGFRLSKRIDLDFDLAATILPDQFDGVVNDFAHDAILSATGGLTFKLGKTDFELVEPMDHALVNGLNAKVNDLRNQVDDLSKRPKSCPECPEVAPTIVNEINYVPNVVFFRINSAQVDENQQISIYNTAQFMKESGDKIRVVGYADKDTGSNNYNLKLSEKRARAVAYELVSKYNIPTQNVIVEWKGAEEQPYKENNWNRVVVMTAQ